MNPDTGMVILDKFADGDWRSLDRLYDSSKMPIEEVMRRQFSMVRATKTSMTAEIDRTVLFRPGFEDLVDTCDRRSVPV